jgi:hypothetical protein
MGDVFYIPTPSGLKDAKDGVTQAGGERRQLKATVASFKVRTGN